MKKMIIPFVFLSLLMACTSEQDTRHSEVIKRIPVTTGIVKMEKIVTALHYSGSIEAFQTIPLNFRTSGTVQTVLVGAGDFVHTGQLLATLDQTDAKSMYEITLSQFEQAKDAYNRLKVVYEKGSLPEIKWVEMESKYTQAKSSMDIARSNLEKCDLSAPLNGMVGRRNIEPGMSSISIASAPLELVDIKQVYIKIAVPENEVGSMVKGMKAYFSVPALSEKSYEGLVTIITPVADRISRTYEVKILVSNPEMKLKPGMVCDVNLQQTMEKEAILIPYQSVSRDSQNNPYVFVISPGETKVTKQFISTGQYHGAFLEVVSGLTAGQVIVIEGKEKLTDNSVIVYQHGTK